MLQPTVGPHLRPRPGARPRRLFGAHGARAVDRDRLPGQVARREAAALAQLLRRPADHQPLRLHRHQAREGDRRRDPEARRSASAASASPSIPPSRKLSGGERQGIAIGRAMHFNADLIVLDEPTVALAVEGGAQGPRLRAAGSRTRGRACIYIEHNLAHVHEVADRLVVLDRGAIVAEIEPEGHVGGRAHRIPDRAAAQGVRRAWPGPQPPRRSQRSRACRSSSCSRCCSRCSCTPRRRCSCSRTSTRPSSRRCRR